MKKSGNMTPPKEHNNAPVTSPKKQKCMRCQTKTQKNCFKKAKWYYQKTELDISPKNRKIIQEQNEKFNTEKS